jgi:hypothetical protein
MILFLFVGNSGHGGPYDITEENSFDEPPAAEESAGRQNVLRLYHITEVHAVTEEAEEETIQEPAEEIELLTDMALPNVSGNFKSYMDFRAITNRRSAAWRLQQTATTDEEGFRRYGELYMVALGTYYSPQAGGLFEIELSTGLVIRCISGDVKSNRCTDTTNRYDRRDRSIVEFIVCTRSISRESRRHGDMSYSGMDGSIVRISKIKPIE